MVKTLFVGLAKQFEWENFQIMISIDLMYSNIIENI